MNSSVAPAPWASEGSGDGTLHPSPPYALDPSVSPASETAETARKSAKGARRRQNSPPSRRPARAGSGKRKQTKQQPVRKKKAKKQSPRDLKKTGAQPGRSAFAGATEEVGNTVAEAEASDQQEVEENRVDDDEGDLETQSASSRVVRLGLTERERQEEMRNAREARDLAEEEECRRAW